VSTSNPKPNDTSHVETKRMPWRFQPCVRCGFCCKKSLCSLAYYFGGNRILDELDANPNMVCPYLKGDQPGEYSCQILEEDYDLGHHVGLGGGCCSSLFNNDRAQAKALWSIKYMTLREMLNKHKWGDETLVDLTLTIRHRGAPNDERTVLGSDITEVGQTGVGTGVEAVEDREVTEDPDWIPYHRVLKVEDEHGKVLWEKRT
jgi:uncharacterized protein (UPF0248 family)